MSRKRSVDATLSRAALACAEQRDLCDQNNDKATGNGWEKLRKDLRRAQALVAILVEAADNVQCACTLRERESGHKIGCSMPYLRAATKAVAS